MDTSGAAPPIERRHARRRSEHVPAFLRPWDTPMLERQPGWIADEAWNGLRLHAPKPFHEGEEVMVYAAGRPRALHARVVWTHPEDREFVAGCRLEPLIRGRRQPARPEKDPSAWLGRALVIVALGGTAALLLYALLFGSTRAF